MATTPQAAAPAASASWLSPAEMRTLEAICDTLIARVSPPPGADDAHGLYARTARDLDVARLMAETLALEDPESQADFHQLLRLLGGALGGVLLAGVPRGLGAMPPERRARALAAMGNHAMPKLRQGFQALKRLALFIFYSAPDASGANPNWPALGFTPPGPPPTPEAAPKRIRPLAVRGDLRLIADAVVVGSGAGGGMVAAELATAGKDVVVLEKGGYYSASDFSGREAEMMPALYLRRGLLATSDLAISVLAGSCLGGGTTVNWSTSFRTPPDVLAEWERDHGITGATGAEHARGFEVAERRMGITTEDSAPNRNNEALRRGCAALGYSTGVIPRNASDCRQRCGACGYGCPFDRKQSTLITFLEDAHQAGARVVVRCQVERVLLEGGAAVGVAGWAPDDVTGERRRVEVRAKAVVVAGGAVESPALLLRSGLTNPNIGRHLRLHPVSSVSGLYSELVEPWAGSLQTVYSEEFARLKGGYGIRLEVAPVHPGLFALAVPWDDAREHKRRMTRIGQASAFIALVRDSGEGHITLNRQGDPIIHYWPNELDRAHLVRGIQEMSRVAASSGATAIGSQYSNLLLEAEDGRPGAFGQARLDAYLAEVARRSIAPNRPPLFTAHQMGTCRLGRDARTAVADPDGAVFGARGLFVADASTFPTASGVNPMLSTLGMAYRVAQRVKAAC
ncbi:MAG TPA: GMC family oxidoreductase [Ktedonobacterales bacterium]|jgi:choline dehydrogenase-like flavoprotein